jgi:2-polyprenyl-6-methoxyphenol hydroxylase-like FAD-dependent oxidoreductase
VLDGLGVAGRRFRMPVRRYAGPDDRVGTLRDLHPGAESGPRRPYGRTLLTPQWRVEEVLRDRLADLGAAVDQGRTVVGLAQEADRATVSFPDGTATAARYVVGCDGGSSAVRRLLGVSFLGETHERIRLLLGDVRLDGLDRDAWHQFGGPTRRDWLGLRPCRPPTRSSSRGRFRPAHPIRSSPSGRSRRRSTWSRRGCASGSWPGPRAGG